MKEKLSIGLDLGHRHINLVKLSKEPEGLKLLDIASVALEPKQGKEEKLKKLVKLIKEKALSAHCVNLGISGESVVVRYIDLPRMKKPELAQALKYEAQQYIPFKIEEVIFDYHLLDQANSTSNRMKVLLVAAKKQAIVELIELIKQAGLKPNLIDVNSFSLVNCFEYNGPKVKEDEVSALINLEFDLANVNILQGLIPFFSRDITLLEDVLSLQQAQEEKNGLFETLRPLLANLIRELRLSFDYFESEFEKQVAIIYLSGEGAGFPELINFFKEQLGREVKTWNPLQNLAFDPGQLDSAALSQTQSMLALATGLALRRLI
ncbi:MAG: type IV pilus assembly protein PilM [Candidatus Omnitrophica bacterium]|nr:type IV pilus assembly protein PilM [Candidatus Omnitrophota bacterium]